MDGLQLGVMFGDVGQPGDGWLAADGGVGSVVIVEARVGPSVGHGAVETFDRDCPHFS